MTNKFYSSKFATIVASITALALSILKLIFGVLSGSVAIIASAIDSLLDVGISIFNFFALKKAESKPSELFNYGLGKVEFLASSLEGAIIFISGLYIFYLSIEKLIEPQESEFLGISLIVMIISFFITLLLVLFLSKVAKVSKSQVVRADALHYRVDLFSNGAVILAVGIVHFSGLHFVDAIFGLLIAIYICFNAFKLICDSVSLLLDRAVDKELLGKIVSVLENVEAKEFSGFHELKTRQAGSIIFIDVHLVFTPNITLFNAHNIADNIESNIKALDSSASFIINAHLDPYDDSHLDSM